METSIGGERAFQNLQFLQPLQTVELRGGGKILKPPGASVHDNIRAMQQIKDPGARKLTFYELVRNKGIWNYKRFYGKQYEDFGNYNAGASGRAAGFSEETLLRGAGWYQEQFPSNYNPAWGHWYGRAPYGDDPRDQYMIRQGIDYYDAGGR